ncbi:MAG: class I adenylate-forming enzyme family protein [Acidimicrobiales bacterium]
MLRMDLVRTLPELMAERARQHPGKTAFVDDNRSVTYPALLENTARLAGHLQEIGLGGGQCALILMGNSVEVVESYLAVPRAGGIAVCANAASALPELAHIFSDCAARVVITDDAHVEAVHHLVAGSPGVRVIVASPAKAGSPADAHTGGLHAGDLRYSDLLVAGAPAPRDCLGLDDTAWMLYTSGTTGRPKGVYLTQRGCLWDVAAAFEAMVELGPDDVMLSPLPLFHSYALVLTVIGITALGATARILPRFSVQDVFERFRHPGDEGPATIFAGVPTMFHHLVERAGAGGLGAPALKRCMSAGAIMPAALNQRFEEAFGVPLLDGYGITETSTMVTMNTARGTRVMGSCGFPLLGLGVRLVDPISGRDVLPDEEGELWVQGPIVTPGYHNNPEATAAAIVDGWYHTGDLARRDQHGYLRITGRTKELIIRGGENIYPAEVEDALLACEAVRDAAVVGAAHEAYGEVPVAFVVAQSPGALDVDAVLGECRQRLSAHKLPAEIHEIDEIPRTGSGKILRFRLQQLLPDLHKITS